jgi:hypothetical protein
MDKHVALNREVLNKKRRIENLTQEFSKVPLNQLINNNNTNGSLVLDD